MEGTGDVGAHPGTREPGAPGGHCHPRNTWPWSIAADEASGLGVRARFACARSANIRTAQRAAGIRAGSHDVDVDATDHPLGATAPRGRQQLDSSDSSADRPLVPRQRRLTLAHRHLLSDRTSTAAVTPSEAWAVPPPSYGCRRGSRIAGPAPPWGVPDSADSSGLLGAPGQGSPAGRSRSDAQRP